MRKADHEVATSVVAQLRNKARQASWATDPAGWARDVLGVHMWSKQREITDSVIENKRTVVASCHGTGKALAVDTPIPTPTGLTPMGELKPGMQVLGSDGTPVTITATTGVHTASRYRIALEGPGGLVDIVASGEHLWPVLQSRPRATAELKSQRVGLPLHTGMWQHQARTVTTAEMKKMIGSHQKLTIPAETPHHRPRGPRWTPDPWLRDLLLSKGAISHDGRPALAWETHHTAVAPSEVAKVRAWLSARGIHSLLQKRRKGQGVTWSLAMAGDAAINVMPDLDTRAVARTRRHLLGGGAPHPGWQVKSVKRIADGLVQCIEVDAEDHLFLCDANRIPTHNSMISSVLICWWISTKPLGEAIAVSTAPTYAQVNRILWEEIRKHHATAKHRGTPMPGYVTQGDEWKAADGKILAFGRKPAHGDRHGFQGIHRRYVLAVLDEACGIPEELWTGVEAITTNDGCRILAVGNPDDRNTEFGAVYTKPENAQDWSRVSVPASSTPNFTGEEVPPLLNEVLVSKSWAEERLRAWGADDPRYISKIMAQFPEQSQSSLFPPAVVNQAFEDVPAQTTGGVLRLGVDVSRFGTDETVVVSFAGVTARIEDKWSGTDTVSSALRVLMLAQEIKDRLKSAWVEIRVDAVGLGAGVVDTLNARAATQEEPWFSVYEMHGSASPPVDVGGSVHGYGNARAYWYDQLRHQMRNGRVQVEDNQRLRDDLAIVFYFFRSGKLYIISKEEMRSKHGRSPDYADALVYATAPVAEGLEQGSTVSEDAADLAREMEDLELVSELEIAPY